MTLHVICLCAEWCGTCRDFRPAFTSVATQSAGDRFQWIDIETHDALLDALGVEIDSFPTVLIAGDDRLCFAGPVTPFADTLQRLCRAARAGTLAFGGESVWVELAGCLAQLPREGPDTSC